ncbi:flagellin [Bacillus piscicola]|uniref:flagellin N-terminal helical domain-containing protein n=1 Tax=Bacillus piscicola TaxID=1632684 RepID=UPI001F08A492|nr:flagellin [Bacillus piscicola]
MIINNNIPALNAYNKLAQNNQKMSNTLEKLSSGLRINRASDDAAGMAISQKMKGQIRGLTQADRNVLDGVSLVQTAEAGLNSIHNMLQRTRELTVQASNDTLTESDRNQLQEEIEQIKHGINDVANHTEFNTIPLLNRTAEVTETKEVTIVDGSETQLTFGSRYDTAPSWSEKRIVFSGADDTTGTNAKIYKKDYSDPDDNGKEIPNLEGFAPALSSNGKRVAYIREDNLYMANDDGTGSVQLTTTDDVTYRHSIYQSSPSWSADDAFIYFSSNKGIEKINVSSKEREMIVEDTSLAFPSVSPDGKEVVYQKGQDIYIVNQDGTENRKVAEGQQPVFSPDGSKIVFSDAEDIFIMDADGSNQQNLTAPMETADQHSHNHHPSWSSDGNKIVFHSDETDGDFGTLWEVTLSGMGEDTETTSGQNIILQVGANEGESFEVILTDARTSALELDDVKVTSQEDALEALDKVDQAIETISKERTKYGAYQNRLDHIHNNLGNYNENVTASESRIADADMALQMTEFTKNNIINQSATAMLAQANQLPQGVLELLK